MLATKSTEVEEGKKEKVEPLYNAQCHSKVVGACDAHHGISLFYSFVLSYEIPPAIIAVSLQRDEFISQNIVGRKKKKAAETTDHGCNLCNCSIVK